MDQEDALLFMVGALRATPDDWRNFGYDVYIPKLIHGYFRHIGREVEWASDAMLEASPVFLDAAWELCRRGILRPGVWRMNTMATPAGGGGLGYSVTPFGRTWLAEAEHDTFVPTEPERFARLLSPYKLRFGAAFHQRAQEAVRCYGAHAYLACCAMCGAEAESVFLAAAVAKSGDLDGTLRTFVAANGRSRVESALTGQASERIQREFRGLASLLKYWRDLSSHGQPAAIDDTEAYTSIALMLRFAAFVDQHWDQLTKGG
jgi:hypothetical protein